MTDEELIARLRDAPADGLGTENLCLAAADRIEQLAVTNEQLVATNEALRYQRAHLPRRHRRHQEWLTQLTRSGKS